MNESQVIRLTPNDLRFLETDQEEAIKLIKKYAPHYMSKDHYERLGASCVMSAVNLIDTIIGSAIYLDGNFLMPDKIHVERLAEWFNKNRDYGCDRLIIMYFMASYIKKKINSLYRSINNNEYATSITIMGHNIAQEEFQKQIQQRKKLGVKVIRQ